MSYPKGEQKLFKTIVSWFLPFPLMTCTFIVWNQFQNWIGNTKISKIILGLQKYLTCTSIDWNQFQTFGLSERPKQCWLKSNSKLGIRAYLISLRLMTSTSIVWNPLQNGIGITNIFKIIWGLRKNLEIHFIIQMRFWNFQNS